VHTHVTFLLCPFHAKCRTQSEWSVGNVDISPSAYRSYLGAMDHEERIRELTERIGALEKENIRLKSKKWTADVSEVGTPPEAFSPDSEQKLSNRDIERYSRQLLLYNGFGVKGQQKLLGSSVLIIGAGGIGSTGMENATCHDVAGCP
jgi:hypothetical protein